MRLKHQDGPSRFALLTLALLVGLLGAMLLTASQPLIRASAAPSSGYSLDWWTVDAGGGASAAGSYQLSGGVAQPDAASLAGGSYQLQGGFWHAQTYFIHLPLVVR
jgi:hypothetical protein